MKKRHITACLFLAPAIIIMLIFMYIPIVQNFYYSLFNWSIYKPGKTFVGLKYFIELFQDKVFWTCLKNNTLYAVISLVGQLGVGLVVAAILEAKFMRKHSGFFRTVFFFPNLLGGLAMGFIWSFIFQNVYSLMLFGEDSPIHIPFLCDMLQDPNKAVFAMAIMATWQTAGYLMLIYLNGLNNIPEDLYEAASIDGATAWQKFRHITVPMLMPAFTIVFFLTLSSSFKMLDENLALTGGDFGTRMLSLQILLTTRENTPPNYGMAQAQAVIFFILIAVVSIVQVIVTKRKEIEA